MVILVSNITIDHCHKLVNNGYCKKKKRPTVLSSALAFVFASPGIFGHVLTEFCIDQTVQTKL